MTIEVTDKPEWKNDSLRITFAFGTDSIRIKCASTCKYLDNELFDWLATEFNRLKTNGQTLSLRADVKKHSTAVCFRTNDKQLQEVIEFPEFMERS